MRDALTNIRVKFSLALRVPQYSESITLSYVRVIYCLIIRNRTQRRFSHSGNVVCNNTAVPNSNVTFINNDTCVNWNYYYTECKGQGNNPFQGTISFDNIGLAWVAIFLVSALVTRPTFVQNNSICTRIQTCTCGTEYFSHL